MRFMVFLILLVPSGAFASVITLDMEGPPIQRPGTAFLINQYVEDGFVMKPLGPIDTTPPFRLARNGGGNAGSPENGGAYLQLLFGNSFEMFSDSGQLFNLLSIDLAEYSTVFDFPATVGFRGIRPDGSIVETRFFTDGIIDGTGPQRDFENFLFPGSFSGLQRVMATNVLFSMDNIRVENVQAISEPPSVALASLGFMLAILMYRRRIEPLNEAAPFT